MKRRHALMPGAANSCEAQRLAAASNSGSGNAISQLLFSISSGNAGHVGAVRLGASDGT
jgi:hypothetical protein